MTATVDQQAPQKRPGSWRDTVFAEYEMSQARLRVLIQSSEEPEEHL